MGLPDVFGLDFVDTYREIERIDSTLDDAREASKAGKDPKDGLRESWSTAKWLRRLLLGEVQPHGQPKPVKGGKKVKVKKVKDVPDGLTEEDLPGLMKGIDELTNKPPPKPEDLQKAIDALEAQKGALLSKHFPKIFGHDYWKICKLLEAVRKHLRRAQRTPAAGDLDTPLKDAAKAKEELEGLLKAG